MIPLQLFVYRSCCFEKWNLNDIIQKFLKSIKCTLFSITLFLIIFGSILNSIASESVSHNSHLVLIIPFFECLSKVLGHQLWKPVLFYWGIVTHYRLVLSVISSSRSGSKSTRFIRLYSLLICLFIKTTQVFWLVFLIQNSGILYESKNLEIYTKLDSKSWLTLTVLAKPVRWCLSKARRRGNSVITLVANQCRLTLLHPTCRTLPTSSNS